ncbi:MAG: hypothetical protein KA010_01970 [Saprospiraceae bacterium]|nr:hypothetical protein [Saprospiraceae bacterium]
MRYIADIRGAGVNQPEGYENGNLLFLFPQNIFTSFDSYFFISYIC